MAINDICNKRCGPGGGTRRLHHEKVLNYGGETGSTRALKIYFSLGIVPPLSGCLISATFLSTGVATRRRRRRVAAANRNWNLASANSNRFVAAQAA